MMVLSINLIKNSRIIKYPNHLYVTDLIIVSFIKLTKQSKWMKKFTDGIEDLLDEEDIPLQN